MASINRDMFVQIDMPFPGSRIAGPETEGQRRAYVVAGEMGIVTPEDISKRGTRNPKRTVAQQRLCQVPFGKKAIREQCC